MRWAWRVRNFVRKHRPKRRLAAIFSRRQNGMSDLRAALAPVMVERGANPAVVIVAFTGGGEKLMMPVYEFFDTTKALGYSRILLCDQYHRRYHAGIDGDRPDFPSLLRYLKEEIARLGAVTVMCIGTSSGGYAAIRAGHELGADYVHAFAPQTGPIDARHRSLLWKRPLDIVDLRRLLEKSNGRTLYYIHYGRGCARDRAYAELLFESPRVAAVGYPSDTHLIAVYLAKKGFLAKALAIENQNGIVALAAAHFAEALEINGSIDGGRAAAAG